MSDPLALFASDSDQADELALSAQADRATSASWANGLAKGVEGLLNEQHDRRKQALASEAAQDAERAAE